MLVSFSLFRHRDSSSEDVELKNYILKMNWTFERRKKIRHWLFVFHMDFIPHSNRNNNQHQRHFSSGIYFETIHLAEWMIDLKSRVLAENWELFKRCQMFHLFRSAANADSYNYDTPFKMKSLFQQWFNFDIFSHIHQFYKYKLSAMALMFSAYFIAYREHAYMLITNQEFSIQRRIFFQNRVMLDVSLLH